MPSSTKRIPVSQLVLDIANPRLDTEQPSQKATQLALATLVKEYLVNIAEDIVSNGLDPTTLLAVVKDESVRRRQFVTLEGNRRLLAIKALETPSIVESVLSPSRRKRLSEASNAFLDDPIKAINCVLFEDADEARYWIELRHTGENAGVGLVRWGTNEQDRFRSRHGGSVARKPAGQIIDFVDRVAPPGPDVNNRILTNVARLIATKEVRDRFGISIERDTVYSNFPADEVYRCLSIAIADFRGNRVRVSDIYHEKDRLVYLASRFGVDDLPHPDTRLTEPIDINVLPGESVAASREHDDHEHDQEPDPGKGPAPNPDPDPDPRSDGDSNSEPGPVSDSDSDSDSDSEAESEAGNSSANSDDETGKDAEEKEGPRRSRARPKNDRGMVIPRAFHLYIADGRINAIHDELRKLPVEVYPNACSVLFRVFTELSVDHYLKKNSVVTEQQRLNSPLAKRVKDASAHMLATGKIDEQLNKAINKVADRAGPLGTSTSTLNQYVHNAYVYPKPSELLTGWDEVEPFVAKLWER